MCTTVQGEFGLNLLIQRADEYKVIDKGVGGIETNFECLIIVRFDAEPGHKTFYHEVHILVEVVGAATEWFHRGK